MQKSTSVFGDTISVEVPPPLEGQWVSNKKTPCFFSRNQFLQEIGIPVALLETHVLKKKKKTFYGLCASLSDKSLLFASWTHSPWGSYPHPKHTRRAAMWPIPCGRRLPSPPTASACWHQWFAVAPASSADRLWRPRSKSDTWSSRAPGSVRVVSKENQGRVASIKSKKTESTNA